MKKAPEISVIMSVYNGSEYLSEAIESVINQTFKDWELIIINDCSTDNTLEILDKYAMLDQRIKVHSNETNLRLPTSLNKALSLSEGKYIARMDADDICMPERFEMQYDFMEKNPQVDLSSCRFMTLKKGVVSSGGGGGRCDSDAVKALLLVTNPVLHPGIIAKSEIIKGLGYDPKFTCTEDMELWTRVVMAGYSIKIQNEYLMLYRLHDKQITGTTLERQHKEVIEVQRKYYGKFLEAMSGEQESFYISGIYFKDEINIEKFCEFYRWLKAQNKKKKCFDKSALNYAMLEILAEYKRSGIGKADILKGILCFDKLFLIREIRNRKKRALKDGKRCISSAEKIGLKLSNGSVEFPVFSE